MFNFISSYEFFTNMMKEVLQIFLSFRYVKIITISMKILSQALYMFATHRKNVQALLIIQSITINNLRGSIKLETMCKSIFISK